VPPEIAGQITASFGGFDEAKATGFFSDVGRKDLYAVYGIWSQTVHPSLATSNTHIDPDSGALRLAPTRDRSFDVMLVAHCLIWAQRALDRLLPDPDRAEGLQNLATAIQAIPVLPDYRPPASPRAGPSPQGQSRGSRSGQRRTEGFDD
jgi:hypothetical protein